MNENEYEITEIVTTVPVAVAETCVASSVMCISTSCLTLDVVRSDERNEAVQAGGWFGIRTLYIPGLGRRLGTQRGTSPFSIDRLLIGPSSNHHGGNSSYNSRVVVVTISLTVTNILAP